MSYLWGFLKKNLEKNSRSQETEARGYAPNYMKSITAVVMGSSFEYEGQPFDQIFLLNFIKYLFALRNF